MKPSLEWIDEAGEGSTDSGGVLSFDHQGWSYRIEVDAGSDPQAIGDAIREALKKHKQKGTQ